ncbi:MAG: type I phosphomannose isomerase catalytic subunit [Halobacteriota archaeon]
MFDYVVVVVSEDLEAGKLRLSPPSKDVLLNSILVPVSESAWNGAAGNGLGTLFAIENASNAIGKDLVEEVKQRGKSVLIVHAAGEGTRNVLARTCKNKAFIEVATLTILEGVIKQFHDFAIPSRILVTWGDQFLLFEDSAEEIRKCAQNTHVLLFGLKTKLTREVASKYGIQIVGCAEAEGCELLDFDDSRNYEVAKRKLQKRGGSEVMVNMGMFAMSGVLAERMLDAFSDNLREREGKFNSDELWQLWISHEHGAETDYWLRERADRLKDEILRAEPLALIKSFPLSDKTAWLDFGTNESYYENVMKILAEDDVGMRLRAFLGVDVSSVKNGCEVLCSVYENAEFEKGLVKNSVISNSTAKHAELKQACVLNSRLNRIRGKKCVVYNVVDHASIEVEDCFLVDVFHPSKGRIRLKMRIGEEKGAKEKWWYSRLPGNDFSLCEIAEMMRDVSEDEMEDTKRRFEGVVEMLVERPLKIKPFVENKPWGYELWCASPRNYCEIETNREFTLDELTSLFPEQILGNPLENKFPLIVKIIKADENLSVQVHPDEGYARKLGDVFGKEEAWHVLEALKGAKIYLGFNAFMNADSIKKAVKNEAFLSCLNAVDAHVGDTYHIPAGVIHALGAGTKVYEVSTASERTFRIYDYGRGRELHLEDAVKVLRFDEEGCGIDLKKEHLLLRKESGFEEYMILRGERFELRLFKVHDRVKVFTEGKPQVLTCVRGDVTLKSKSNTNTAELSLTPMETVLVPACVESFELEGEGEILCGISSIISKKRI